MHRILCTLIKAYLRSILCTIFMKVDVYSTTGFDQKIASGPPWPTCFIIFEHMYPATNTRLMANNPLAYIKHRYLQFWTVLAVFESPPRTSLHGSLSAWSIVCLFALSLLGWIYRLPLNLVFFLINQSPTSLHGLLSDNSMVYLFAWSLSAKLLLLLIVFIC